MKKMLSLMAALALLMSLCACGGTAAQTDTEETEPAAETETAEETSAAEEEPEETPELEVETETEEEAGIDLYDAWDIINQYGFNDDGTSVLSYELDPATIADEGDYYTVTAILSAGITVPTDLNEGDQITVTVDDLTGETMTLTYNGNNTFTDESGYDGYYFFETDESTAYLYQDSDDRVDSEIYVGTIRIAKGAEFGIPIIDTYAAIEDTGILDGTDTQYGTFFNTVQFDESGCAVSLLYYGD